MSLFIAPNWFTSCSEYLSPLKSRKVKILCHRSTTVPSHREVLNVYNFGTVSHDRILSSLVSPGLTSHEVIYSLCGVLGFPTDSNLRTGTVNRRLVGTSSPLERFEVLTTSNTEHRSKQHY